jgi:hypothetical protein
VFSISRVNTQPVAINISFFSQYIAQWGFGYWLKYRLFGSQKMSTIVCTTSRTKFGTKFLDVFSFKNATRRVQPIVYLYVGASGFCRCEYISKVAQLLWRASLIWSHRQNLWPEWRWWALDWTTIHTVGCTRLNSLDPDFDLKHSWQLSSSKVRRICRVGTSSSPGTGTCFQ